MDKNKPCKLICLDSMCYIAQYDGILANFPLKFVLPWDSTWMIGIPTDKGKSARGKMALIT